MRSSSAQQSSSGPPVTSDCDLRFGQAGFLRVDGHHGHPISYSAPQDAVHAVNDDLAFPGSSGFAAGFEQAGG